VPAAEERLRSKAFGRLVAARRKSKGLKQAALAENMGVKVRTISRWENGHTLLKINHIAGLKRELGFTQNEIDDALGANTKVRYSVCSQGDAAEILGSLENYFKRQGEIMDEFPVPEEPGEYGTKEKWLSLMKMTPDYGGAVVFQGGTIVGYWQSLAVSEITYRKILNGENVNKTLSKHEVIIPLVPGVYKMYFVDLFLLTAHSNNTTRSLIIKNFMAFLHTSAIEGIFFDRIAANITSTPAERICEHLGFKKVVDHKVHRFLDENNAPVSAIIYELDIGKGAKELFSFDKELKQLYVAKGLMD